MRLHKFYTIVLMVLLSAGVTAQTTTATQTKTSTTTSKTTGNSSDSLKQAINNLKTSFNGLFGGKKDTIAITISDIDYDDANLATLKDNLKNIKGVKSVTMKYKSSCAVIDVPYKGVATDLWDKLPVDTKKPFKLLEASDNSITLKYKNATASNN
jgi:hypothetical protein